MYFDKFPKILYEFNVNNQTEYKLMTDITRNMRVIQEVLANVTLYDEYDIRDGETPEIIADRVYGSPFYHWVIMLVNDKYDYLNDWPLPQVELDEFIKDKYGFELKDFDSSDPFIVNVPNSTIYYAEHPYKTGDAVIYSFDSGDAIAPLKNGKKYYVIKQDNNLFKLATSKERAMSGTFIELQSLGTGQHSIELDNEYAVHHYETEQGFIVDQNYEDVYGVTGTIYEITNREYEEKINESKRRIKLISPNLLSTILKNFEEQI